MKISLIRIVTCVFFPVLALRAEPVPPWWIERGVVNLSQPADDHALANQGQLKHIASRAKLELDARLSGGAGAAINTLVGAWTPPASGVNDYAVVTANQAKAFAALFYARIVSPVPWPSGTSGGPDHDAALVVGQIKDLFAFVWAPPNGSFPGGFVRRQQQGDIEGLGLNPYPVLEKLAGDGQEVAAAQMASEALVVKARAGLFAMPTAKVRFSVPVSGGVAGKLVAVDNPTASGVSPRLVISTDVHSEASVLWKAPLSEGIYSVSARLMRWPASPPVTFVIHVGDLGAIVPNDPISSNLAGLQLFTPLHLVP